TCRTSADDGAGRTGAGERGADAGAPRTTSARSPAVVPITPKHIVTCSYHPSDLRVHTSGGGVHLLFTHARAGRHLPSLASPLSRLLDDSFWAHAPERTRSERSQEQARLARRARFRRRARSDRVRRQRRRAKR